MSWLDLASSLARTAGSLGEVPVGCVIVRDGLVIATGFNRKESFHDPTGHAEIIAIRRAARRLGNWRLTSCHLYTSLEPCVMCMGAIVHSRIASVSYSLLDPKFGAAQSLYRVGEDERLNHKVATHFHPCPSYESLLRGFFKDLRRGP